MSRGKILWCSVGIALLVLLAAFTFRVGAKAQTGLHDARERFFDTQVQVEEVRRLRELRERVATSRRPTQEILASVNRVLGEAGIPSPRLHSVDPEGTVEVQNSGGATSRYRTQSFSVKLQALSVPEVGAFLEEWCRREPLWIPTRIELHHPEREGLGTNVYDLSLLLSASYLAESVEGEAGS